jgi:hypothetical protein
MTIHGCFAFCCGHRLTLCRLLKAFLPLVSCQPEAVVEAFG